MNPNTPTMTVHRARSLYTDLFPEHGEVPTDTIRADIAAWQDAGGITYCTFHDFLSVLYHHEKQDNE